MELYIVQNSTSEPITIKWDGIEYALEAGETKYLEKHLAYQFGKYLAMREMKKDGKVVNANENNFLFKQYFTKFVSSSPIVSGAEDEIYTELAKKGLSNVQGERLYKCDVEGCDYTHGKESGIRLHKMSFHKLKPQKKDEKKEEEEFEGLKEIQKKDEKKEESEKE